MTEEEFKEFQRDALLLLGTVHSLVEGHRRVARLYTPFEKEALGACVFNVCRVEPSVTESTLRPQYECRWTYRGREFCIYCPIRPPECS